MRSTAAYATCPFIPTTAQLQRYHWNSSHSKALVSFLEILPPAATQPVSSLPPPTQPDPTTRRQKKPPPSPSHGQSASTAKCADPLVQSPSTNSATGPKMIMTASNTIQAP